MVSAVRKRRDMIGADCMECDFQVYGNDSRTMAKRHAQTNPGHHVHLAVEEVTVYLKEQL